MIRIDESISRIGVQLYSTNVLNNFEKFYYEWRKSQYMSNNIYLSRGYQEAASLNIETFRNLQLPFHPDFFARSHIFGPTWVSNIGHIVNLSTYAKIKQLSWLEKTSLTLFYSSSANEALVEKYRSFFSIHKFDAFTQSILDLNLRTHYSPMEIVNTHKFGILDNYKAQHIVENFIIEKMGFDYHLLNLTIDELESGKTFMQKFGLDPECWFVSFHMRETNDLTEFRGGDNVNPSTYIDAIMKVVELGGQVVRIGNPDMTPLSNMGVQHPKILDYATQSIQTNSQNLFWLSACKFLVGTGSGPVLVPNEFGRPILYTNVPAIGRTRRLRGISLPQLLHDRESETTLHFEKMLDTPLAWNVAPSNNRFTRIYNSSNDITAGVMELFNLTENQPDHCWLSPNLRIDSLKNEIKSWEIGVPVGKTFIDTHPELVNKL